MSMISAISAKRLLRWRSQNSSVQSAMGGREGCGVAYSRTAAAGAVVGGMTSVNCMCTQLLAPGEGSIRRRALRVNRCFPRQQGSIIPPLALVLIDGVLTIPLVLPAAEIPEG